MTRKKEEYKEIPVILNEDMQKAADQLQKQSIKNMWDKNDKEKREKLFFEQQGTYSIATKDPVTIHRQNQKWPKEEEEFTFDPAVPGLQRFIEFRQDVIKNSKIEEDKDD